MTDERLKLWLNFLKWVLSSVVITGGIGIATVVLDAKRQETELQIKVNEQEKNYLTSFLERALDDNLEKRHRFAQYFAALTQSDTYKKGWENYLDKIKVELAKTRSKLEAIEGTLQEKSGEDLERAQDEIAELRAQLKTRASLYTSTPDIKLFAPLKSISDHDLKCPAGNKRAVWSENIAIYPLRGYWDADYYIAVGCVNKAGIKDGPYAAFHPNGQLAQTGTYVDGLVNGTVATFFDNGTRAAEWQKLKGIAHGSARFWDKKGNMMYTRYIR